jgi:hypothetical protein
MLLRSDPDFSATPDGRPFAEDQKKTEDGFVHFEAPASDGGSAGVAPVSSYGCRQVELLPFATGSAPKSPFSAGEES